MNSKLKDRFATSILYVIAGIICALLLGIIGYVLVLGVPQISWNFFNSPVRIIFSRWWDWTTVVQLLLSFILNSMYQCSDFIRSSYLSVGICER